METDFLKYSTGVYMDNQTQTVNMTLLVVGYGEDYWLVENVWGTNWGEKGYGKVGKGLATGRVGVVLDGEVVDAAKEKKRPFQLREMEYDT